MLIRTVKRLAPVAALALVVPTIPPAAAETAETVLIRQTLEKDRSGLRRGDAELVASAVAGNFVHYDARGYMDPVGWTIPEGSVSSYAEALEADLAARRYDISRTVTLFQNVWVLSVGDDIGQPQAVLVNDGDEEVYQPAGLGNGRTVTLAVYPDEAQKLIMAQELGDLSLTLRSLWETERAVELEHATIHNTLGIPQRVRARQRARWEVIRTGGF